MIRKHVPQCLDLFKVIVYGLYHGIHHHRSPPFGEIVLELFSKHLMQIQVIVWKSFEILSNEKGHLVVWVKKNYVSKNPL